MHKDYPRPQLARNNWKNLNGIWQFKFDDNDTGEQESWYNSSFEDSWQINVPFTYETKLSGIHEEQFHPVVWYQKNITYKTTDKYVLLHFEGADYITKVWVNGKCAGTHQGGYSRFTFNITKFLSEGDNNITVRVEDSTSCVQPRGKQTWKKEGFECWYTQTTGIWKTVWLEEVTKEYIESVKITPDIDNSKVKFEIKLNEKPASALYLSYSVFLDENLVTSCQLCVNSKYTEFEATVASMEEPWKMALWTPGNPKLYNAELILEGSSGKDEVLTYFGMRKISIEDGKVLLNNKPFYQKLILDQGYWEQSGLTAPSTEALINDISLIQAAGYNGLRKHEKIEDERFLYWCDKKGLVVWCEMPSQYIFNNDTMECYISQWTKILKQNYNHPCIITWTAFNESWGIEKIYTDVRQQKFTESIYYLTKAYDPMRPVILNDGWEHTISDIITLHDYEESGETFVKRYQDKPGILENKIPFNHERYAFAKGFRYNGQPVILSEFGGIALSCNNGWGYGKKENSSQEFMARFENIVEAVKQTKYITGFCYTQLTDVYHETNGLYTMQREPKADIEKIRQIHQKI